MVQSADFYQHINSNVTDQSDDFIVIQINEFQAGQDAEQYIHSIILFLVYFIIVVSKDQFILQFLGSKHLSFVIFQCL